MAVIPSPKLQEIYDGLPDEDAKDLLAALNSHWVPAESLAWALEANGIPVSPSLIRTTRRRMKYERLQETA